MLRLFGYFDPQNRRKYCLENLPTRFLTLRRLRLVTVRVLVFLRLANDFNGPDLNLCVQKKRNG